MKNASLVWNISWLQYYKYLQRAFIFKHIIKIHKHHTHIVQGSLLGTHFSSEKLCSTVFYPFWKRNFKKADDQRIFELLRYVWAFFIKNAKARFTIYFLLKKSWISNYSSITAKYLTGYWLFSDAKTPPPLPKYFSRRRIFCYQPENCQQKG